MALTKYRIGDLLELTNEKNSAGEFGEDDAIGVNIDKVILPMRGNLSNKDFLKFHLVPPRHFAYNPRGSRKLGIGFNDTDNTYIVTFNDNVFRVKDSAKAILDETFLFMYLSRKEWDRYSEFISWGSSTEVFDWTCFCDETIFIPSLDIQKRYVDIYKSLKSNQKDFETSLENIRLAYEYALEDIKKRFQAKTIGEYIIRRDEKNKDNEYSNVKNVSVTKEFSEVSSKVNKKELSGYKIVRPRDIAFVQTTHNEHVFCNAMNNTDDVILVTSVNEVFGCNEDYLLPEYLCAFLHRTEFDRYARFHSWGSVRETFTWYDMLEVKVPLPPVDIQRALADIFTVYRERRQINLYLQKQLKEICPILVKGAIEEGR